MQKILEETNNKNMGLGKRTKEDSPIRRRSTDRSPKNGGNARCQHQGRKTGRNELPNERKSIKFEKISR